ncbi:uncharacterized protein BDV17DRAFT_288558 [Aspergillus undulatus]|uniref:uncharacterized protein n=1 Tax=Aspergillus undulatus TaxID=1810928 RepID=UPI003CCDD16D
MEYNIENMDWFDRLESMVTRLLVRTKDPKTQVDVMAAFQVARAESQSEQQGQFRSLVASKIRPKVIMGTFKLTYDMRPDRIWQLPDGEQRYLTKTLNGMLKDYDTALGDADETDMSIRHRLDAIFHSTLASSRREHYGTSNNGPMQWQYDHLIESPLVYRGKPAFLSGRADYVLSCGSLNWMETNCVVIRAQRQGLSGEYEALSLAGWEERYRDMRHCDGQLLLVLHLS